MLNNIYHWIGFCVVWLAALVSVWFTLGKLWRLTVFIYKRTYVHYALETFYVWYKFEHKHGKINLTQPELEAFKKNKVVLRMPERFRKVFIRVIERGIQDRRDEIIAHGEVPGF